jgi:ubiquinone/menaquinone biosynthesis C-methylase UbiE
MKTTTDYDELAGTYNHRYAANPMEGVGRALRALLIKIRPKRVLEVGCGTGHWLAEIHSLGIHTFGLDRNLSMLRQAQKESLPAGLVQGDALKLPYANSSLDLIFCVNAIHHFRGCEAYLTEVFRVLRHGGTTLIFGMDPHDPETHLYEYDFFPGVYQHDLNRFPASTALLDTLRQCGFTRVDHAIIERNVRRLSGRDVFSDPFLDPKATSQLADLTPDEYQEGIHNMEKAIQDAEAAGSVYEFRTTIPFRMLSAIKP